MHVYSSQVMHLFVSHLRPNTGWRILGCCPLPLLRLMAEEEGALPLIIVDTNAPLMIVLWQTRAVTAQRERSVNSTAPTSPSPPTPLTGLPAALTSSLMTCWHRNG